MHSSRVIPHYSSDGHVIGNVLCPIVASRSTTLMSPNWSLYATIARSFVSHGRYAVAAFLKAALTTYKLYVYVFTCTGHVQQRVRDK